MKVDRNIMMNKAGGTSGKSTFNYRISIPVEMIKKLKITEDDRAVVMEWDQYENAIKIYKKEK